MVERLHLLLTTKHEGIINNERIDHNTNVEIRIKVQLVEAQKFCLWNIKTRHLCYQDLFIFKLIWLHLNCMYQSDLKKTTSSGWDEEAMKKQNKESSLTGCGTYKQSHYKWKYCTVMELTLFCGVMKCETAAHTQYGIWKGVLGSDRRDCTVKVCWHWQRGAKWIHIRTHACLINCGGN